MKITVVGTGYVGLVTGAIFSIQGHEVICVDLDEAKIEGLKRGQLPIYEPGLDEIVEMGVNQGSLYFTTDLASAASESELVFLAVGTPQSESGAANLDYLIAAAESVADAIPKGAIVVIKSTVPVGTNARIAKVIEERCGRKVDVANNPEFLKEGTALDDCLNPDRIVLGVRNKRVGDILQKLYAPLVTSAKRPCPMLVMDPESAEMTKYTANCMLAMKISFINEIANLCERLGADVEFVREGICSDRRIGREFLKPGAGYGGSCFPKDVRALMSQATAVGFEAKMLHAVDEVNELQKQVIPRKVLEHFDGDVKGKRITIWGLAFKPGTDDIREAPALTLIAQLLAAGAEIHVHDPEAMANVRKVFGDSIAYHEEKYESLHDSQALVVMTDWKEYVGVDPSVLRWHMRDAIVFDGRNCLYRDWFELSSLTYYSIGQAPVHYNQNWLTLSDNNSISQEQPTVVAPLRIEESGSPKLLPCV